MFLSFNYETELLNLGTALFTRRNYQEAIFILERASVHFPANVEGLRLLAESQLANGEIEPASVTAHRALYLESNSPLVLATVARVKNAMVGNQSTWHQSATVAELEYCNDLFKLSEKLVVDDNATEASVVLAHAAHLFPDSYECLVRFGKVSLLRQHHAEAEDAFRKGIAIAPARAQSHLGLANFFVDRGDNASAQISIQTAQRAINSSAVGGADTIEDKRELALALVRIENFEEASAVACEVVSAEPHNASHHCLLAEIFMKRGQLLEAEQALNRAFEYDPSSLEALRILVRLYISGNQAAMAMPRIQQVTARLPMEQFSDIALLIADVFEAMGQPENAREFLRNAQHRKSDRRVSERLRIIRAANTKFSKPTRNLKQMVFVETDPRARSMRMAGALKKIGWEVILLHQSAIHFDAKPYFSATHQFRDEDDALSVAAQLNPRAFHIFSGIVDEVALQFIREKPGKIIFDPYDTVEGCMKRKEVPEYIYRTGQLQRFCIENADALCCRDLRIRFLREHLHYRTTAATIFFCDYCPSATRLSAPIVAGSNEPIHVVICGTIITSKSGHEVDWGYLAIAKKLIEHGIHVHFYPHPRQAASDGFREEFAEFFQLARETPLFHFHDPVPMDRLSSELSNYHFGINTTFALSKNQGREFYYEANFRYASSARNVDYLSAGLPMIIDGARYRFQHGMYHRYRMSVDATPVFFKNPKRYLQDFVSDPGLISHVQRAQSAYSIDKNIARLARFYERF